MQYSIAFLATIAIAIVLMGIANAMTQAVDLCKHRMSLIKIQVEFYSENWVYIVSKQNVYKLWNVLMSVDVHI